MIHTAPLGEVAEFTNGYAFKPQHWEDDGKPIVRIQNLTDPGKPFNRTRHQVPERYCVRPGDLLVSWSASLGVFTWSRPEPGLVNQHIFRVDPGPSITTTYLKHMLQGALAQMKNHMHGATMQHVNRADFLGTRIPLPPIEEQRRIAAILDQADSTYSNALRGPRLLEEMSASLVDKMASSANGRIPLQDVAEVQGGLQVTAKRRINPIEVPYLRVANVYRGEIRLNEIKTIRVTAPELERVRLQSSDLLLVEGHGTQLKSEEPGDGRGPSQHGAPKSLDSGPRERGNVDTFGRGIVNQWGRRTCPL